jgi:hypothetical protein
MRCISLVGLVPLCVYHPKSNLWRWQADAGADGDSSGGLWWRIVPHVDRIAIMFYESVPRYRKHSFNRPRGGSLISIMTKYCTSCSVPFWVGLAIWQGYRRFVSGTVPQAHTAQSRFELSNCVAAVVYGFAIAMGCVGGLLPVHCTVTAWTTWSACSVSCGGGTQQQTRTVTQAAANGGAACPILTNTQACNTQPCPGIDRCCETPCNHFIIIASVLINLSILCGSLPPTGCTGTH